MKRNSLCLCISLFFLSPAYGGSLSELYHVGVKNSLSVNAERSTYLAGLEGEKQSFAQFLPELRLSATMRYDSMTQEQDAQNLLQLPNKRKTASDTTEYEIGVSQRLFDLPTYYNYKASQSGSIQAKVKFHKAISTYTNDFLSAYLEVAKARERLLFIQETLTSYEKQSSIIGNRYAVGLVKVSEVKESESQQLQAQADEALAKNDLAIAFDQLSLLTQQDVVTIRTLSNEIPVLLNESQSVELFLAKYKNNWDYKSAQLDAVITRENWKAAKSRYLPKVTSRLSYTDNNTDSSYDFQHPGVDHRQGWNVGVYFDVPLYSGGEISSSSSEAKLLMKRSEYLQQFTRNEVKQQIVRHYSTLHAMHRSLVAKSDAVEAVELALENAQSEYFNGLGSFTRVLDNRARLMSEKVTLIQDKYEYMKLFVSMKELVGELSADEVSFFSRLFNGSEAHRASFGI